MTHLRRIRELFINKKKLGKIQDIVASNMSTENKIKSIKKVHIRKGLEKKAIMFAKRQEHEEYIRGFGWISKENFEEKERT